jgi:hypothetical protein
MDEKTAEKPLPTASMASTNGQPADGSPAQNITVSEDQPWWKGQLGGAMVCYGTVEGYGYNRNK